MTVREIHAFLKEAYAVEGSPDLISAVTDAIVAEVTAWQSRPLEPLYPVVFFDAAALARAAESDGDMATDRLRLVQRDEPIRDL